MHAVGGQIAFKTTSATAKGVLQICEAYVVQIGLNRPVVVQKYGWRGEFGEIERCAYRKKAYIFSGVYGYRANLERTITDNGNTIAHGSKRSRSYWLQGAVAAQDT